MFSSLYSIPRHPLHGDNVRNFFFSVGVRNQSQRFVNRRKFVFG